MAESGANLINIKFKTLSQKTFQIEIGQEELVSTLKSKIEAQQSKNGEFPASQQRLIYAGKILDDGKPISEYKIDTEKGFVVIMACKPKPVEGSPVTTSSVAVSSATTSSALTSTPALTTSVSESSTSTSQSVSPTMQTTAASTPLSSTTNDPSLSAESQLVTGSALESSVTELMSMGFPRDQVELALARSFNNPDRACDYLMSGTIPPAEDIFGSDAAATAAPPTQPSSTASPTPATPQTDSLPPGEGISFLRNVPQFLQMRQLIQSNPQALPQLLQELGRGNPQLLQRISANQAEFIRLLNEPLGTEGSEDVSGFAPSAGAGAPVIPFGGPAAAAGGQAPPQAQDGAGVMQIQATPDDQASIERLKALGFSESDVIQAYFACDRNENLAANLLLE